MDDQEKLVVYILTHGTHHSGGKTVEDYDGDLTDEAKEKLRAIEVPIVNLHFTGVQKRHTQTAEACGVLNYTQNNLLGNDRDMFRMVIEGDETPLQAFIDEINVFKKRGMGSVLIVTSRGYLLAMHWMLMAPKQREALGSFKNFVINMDWADKNLGGLSEMQSGAIYRFEV